MIFSIRNDLFRSHLAFLKVEANFLEKRICKVGFKKLIHIKDMNTIGNINFLKGLAWHHEHLIIFFFLIKDIVDFKGVVVVILNFS